MKTWLALSAFLSSIASADTTLATCDQFTQMADSTGRAFYVKSKGQTYTSQCQPQDNADPLIDVERFVTPLANGVLRIEKTTIWYPNHDRLKALVVQGQLTDTSGITVLNCIQE